MFHFNISPFFLLKKILNSYSEFQLEIGKKKKVEYSQEFIQSAMNHSENLYKNWDKKKKKNRVNLKGDEVVLQESVY